MRTLNIKINGFRYQLACDDGQEDHISQLAEEIDMRVQDVVNKMPNISESKALVMASLMLADELYEARQEAGELHEILAEMENPSGKQQLRALQQQNDVKIEDTVLTSEAQASLAFAMDEVAQQIESIVDNVRNKQRTA